MTGVLAARGERGSDFAGHTCRRHASREVEGVQQEAPDPRRHPERPRHGEEADGEHRRLRTRECHPLGQEMSRNARHVYPVRRAGGAQYTHGEEEPCCHAQEAHADGCHV